MTYHYTPLELHKNSLDKEEKTQKNRFFQIKSLDKKLEFKGTKTTNKSSLKKWFRGHIKE